MEFSANGRSVTEHWWKTEFLNDWRLRLATSSACGLASTQFSTPTRGGRRSRPTGRIHNPHRIPLLQGGGGAKETVGNTARKWSSVRLPALRTDQSETIPVQTIERSVGLDCSCRSLTMDQGFSQGGGEVQVSCSLRGWWKPFAFMLAVMKVNPSFSNTLTSFW